MILTRRGLLRSIAGLVAAGAPASRLVAAMPGYRHFATARTGDGGHVLVGLDDGRSVELTALPGRGHGLTRRPGGGELVVMARRPDAWALIVDPVDGAVRHRLSAPDGHHFYGHAAFTPDGKLMLTTENAYDAMAEEEQTGRLGIWDATDGYRRVGVIATQGIGPHDVMGDPARGGFWIAQGGLLTHPDTGRTKLNIPDMDPSVTWIAADLKTVGVDLRLPAEQHKLGIRHLDVAQSGRVAIAMQDEGAALGARPLVGVVDDGTPPRLFALPDGLAARSRGYCGDVALDPEGSVLGAGFPRGGFFGFWNAGTGAFLAALDIEDGCAITRDGGASFGVTAGTGTTGAVSVAERRDGALDFRAGRAPLVFDNHMI